MKLYAGVDGGGSKTLTLVVDEQGNEVGRRLAAGSNAQGVGVPEAVRRIKMALQEAGGNRLPLDGICIGLAGIDRPDDRPVMLAALNEAGLVTPEKLWLGNDGE